jgi:hypothetical protein
MSPSHAGDACGVLQTPLFASCPAASLGRKEKISNINDLEALKSIIRRIRKASLVPASRKAFSAVAEMSAA